MRFSLLLACCLLSLTTFAQDITGDSTLVVSASRARLVSRLSKGYFYIKTRPSGTDIFTKFWTRPTVNGVGINDNTGNYTIPVGATTFSGLSGLLQASQFSGLSGDVNVPSGSTVATLSNGSVGNAKLAQQPALTIKGNNTGSAATAVDLTVPQSRSLLNVDQVNNTADADKPVSTVQAAINAVKATAKTVSVSNLANGATATHNLNTTNLVDVLFFPTGSAVPDRYFTATASGANAVTIATPQKEDGTFEAFTGTIKFIALP